jgi:hypothetical protein
MCYIAKRHIGVSNAYLKSVNHPLSIEYPDTVGILEAMHAATALSIFRQPGIVSVSSCMMEREGCSLLVCHVQKYSFTTTSFFSVSICLTHYNTRMYFSPLSNTEYFGVHV